MVGVTRPKVQTFKGGSYLRHRLVLSTLSAHPIRITQIRPDDSDAPGLSPSEISFIRLLDKLTSGTTVEINETGTALLYKPGLLLGADRLVHECHPSRAVAYYLQPLLMLAPFCKRPLNLILRGPTHAVADPCIDTLAAVSIPMLRRLTLAAALDPRLDVRRRAVASPRANGAGRAGAVAFRCGMLTAKLRPVDLVEAGYVKRVRGLAFANRASPTHIARMVDATRGALNAFTPDVYVHTDHANSDGCGVGFGVQLAAETTEGCLVGADWVGARADVAPEEVAQDACRMLLEEVAGGGCVDSGHLCLALLFCALADSDVSRVRVGKLTEAAVQFMRDIERLFGVVFNVKVVEEESEEESGEESEEEEEEEGKRKSRGTGGGIILSCVGVGLSNVARQRF